MDEKVTNTEGRLKEIMKERHLRQVDIVNLCKPYGEKYGVKISAGALSQYLSGKYVPDQKKLFILGLGLNVSEAWLMGYDVPQERRESKVSETTLSDIKEWIEASEPSDVARLIAYASRILAEKK